MPHELHVKTAGGHPVLLRPLERGDRAALADAVERFSNRSRYMRFFSGMSRVPDPVLDKLADVDGSKHIAWVAIDTAAPGQPVIGAAHAMRTSGHLPVADFAIGLVDDWQNKGIARLLIALLAAESRTRGIQAMTADVLRENRQGRALMKALAAEATGADSQVVHYRFDLGTTLAKLRGSISSPALEAVFSAIEGGAVMPAAA